jgi:hypothetical protein
MHTRLPTEEGLGFKHWPGPGIETGAWDYDLRPHGPAVCVLRRAGRRFSKQVPHGPGAVRALIYRLSHRRLGRDLRYPPVSSWFRNCVTRL